MKIRTIVFTVSALALGAAVQAQEVRGVVRDAEGQPLVGASVYWAGTTVGTSTDAEGVYHIHRVKNYDNLVASYLGYMNDTLRVASGAERAEFALRSEGVELDDVVIEGNLSGNYVKHDGIMKGEMISFAGLCKMACCNLAESFENSASVTVGYSDAISGARQIKMLGLAGTYTQILDENRPIMRGLSAPYGLSYTPGMWLNSIQVSKGVSSVTAGHEAITGQINLEHRKPTDNERLFVNLYLDDELRPEANISTAFPVSRDKKLTSVILLHGSMDTDVRKMDHNHDGFRDLPKAAQINVANKWLYAADNGTQIRWGWKFVQENRLGGMMGYKNKAAMREAMSEHWDWQRTGTAMPLYGSHIRNRGANGYFKIGTPVGPAVYDEEEQDEMRSNLALVVDFDHFDEDAYFGLNDYDGNENTLSANLMYAHYFTYRSSLNVGVQGHFSRIREHLLNRTPWLAQTPEVYYDLDRNENEAGAYAEYTYTLGDKFSLVAGVRGDYNSYYDKFYFTPRGHVKWNITRTTVLRASAGLGYRSTNVITDNIGILATGRRIVLPDYREKVCSGRAFDRMEKALTVGGSLTQSFSVLGTDNMTLHAVLQFGGGRSGVRRGDDPHLRHPRPLLHRHLPGRFFVDSGRAARHLRDVPLHRQRDDDQPSGRHDGARGTSSGESVQDAFQHPVCHQVPPMGVRCDGPAQRSVAHPDAERHPGRRQPLAELSDVLRAGEPQAGQVRHLCGLREHRRLPAERPDPACVGSLLLRVQLHERVGAADGPQVLHRHAVEPLLR